VSVGVFINYRSADQPFGAAAIHDALARRFGAEKVFRDCVSMEAGEEYPKALRENLERAHVLVAVIGPHWLDLTEPETGSALIRRRNDWVRWEIARAFQRNIPVVPVRLTDTPDSGPRIRRADLPDDIERLADLQMHDISQRRFGDDVERLAARLVRLAPTLVTSPASSPAPPVSPAASPSVAVGGAPTTTPTLGAAGGPAGREPAGGTRGGSAGRPSRVEWSLRRSARRVVPLLLVVTVCVVGVVAWRLRPDSATGGAAATPSNPAGPSVSPSCGIAPYQMPSSSIAGTIASPRPDEKVPQQVPASGTIATLPAGYTLWTISELAGPPGHPLWEKFKCGGNRVWPGPGPLTVNAGTWSAIVALGDTTSDHSGLRHRLTIVAVDARARTKFEEYNRTAPPSYRGIVATDLVDSAGSIERVASVEVTRT
jgi:hypothetical protein